MVITDEVRSDTTAVNTAAPKKDKMFYTGGFSTKVADEPDFSTVAAESQQTAREGHMMQVFVRDQLDRNRKGTFQPENDAHQQLADVISTELFQLASAANYDTEIAQQIRFGFEASALYAITKRAGRDASQKPLYDMVYGISNRDITMHFMNFFDEQMSNFQEGVRTSQREGQAAYAVGYASNMLAGILREGWESKSAEPYQARLKAIKVFMEARKVDDPVRKSYTRFLDQAFKTGGFQEKKFQPFQSELQKFIPAPPVIARAPLA